MSVVGARCCDVRLMCACPTRFTLSLCVSIFACLNFSFVSILTFPSVCGCLCLVLFHSLLSWTVSVPETVSLSETSANAKSFPIFVAVPCWLYLIIFHPLTRTQVHTLSFLDFSSVAVHLFFMCVLCAVPVFHTVPDSRTKCLWMSLFPSLSPSAVSDFLSDTQEYMVRLGLRSCLRLVLSALSFSALVYSLSGCLGKNMLRSVRNVSVSQI